MKTILGIKIGGLQQKIFNLALIIILLLVGTYVAMSAYQQSELSRVVQKAGSEQQASINDISAQTMAAVLDSSMARTNALQAYIADDLFSDVRTGVITLQAFAQQLFEHEDLLPSREVLPPSSANEGVPSVQLIHEDGVDPAFSGLLATVSNMSDILLAVYESSYKMSSCFVGTADGCMLLVNDRPGVFLSEDGEPLNLDLRSRPWYVQAANAKETVFTGVVTDANTPNSMLECAAPVYWDGELVAVVAADIYLTSISDYVERTSSEGIYLCVINQNGQVLFSPADEGVFRAGLSDEAEDLRQSDNALLASFVTRALEESTPLELISIDGKEYYLVGSPLETLGWTVISVVEKEITQRPAEAMLAQYESINDNAREIYNQGAKKTFRMFLGATVLIVVLAISAALILASRVVKPLEHMTLQLNELGDGGVFTVEDSFRTGDEIEILAETFASMSERSKEYVSQITRITAENERIGTELALATRIQADMLPNIFPPFPERSEFDLFASMDPAKEVGGDFYDYFLIDDDHLCMVMADVSGKGVPAALFMMASKIILANNAMMGKSPGRILTDTNKSICDHNREEMFVTVWLGILEISTGIITAANGGHEYPVIKTPGGAYELYKDRHGLVIGGMAGVQYKDYTLTLEPGSRLFLYTDGVPEATDADKRLFGLDRMLDALNAAPDASPREVLKNVRASVDGFVRDAEQFDDLTMLCLEYRGPAAKEENA
ncbi:MAG: SpoIIE family protein phosphatase [Clostridiales bacterium]|nr:SpoIIE family protein phosphatase [Clostridiales bacterium]